MSARVYKFGLRPPVAEQERVNTQLRLTCVYYNKLIELQREHRARLRALNTKLGLQDAQNTLAAAAEDLESARNAINASKAETRSNKVPQHLKDRASLCLDAFCAARTQFFTTLAHVSTLGTPEREDSHELWLAQRSPVRKAPLEVPGPTGSPVVTQKLFWGSYQLIEDSVDQACASTPLYTPSGEPQDPQFRNWRGTGTLSVQLAGKFQPSTLFSCTDTRARIEIIPDREGRNGPRWGRLWLRIGSVKAKPVWGVWPIKLHRDFPDGTRITRISVSCKHVGPRTLWSTEIALDTPAEKTCGVGLVALDIGWRNTEGERRICAWVDEDGDRGELRLSAELLSALEYPSELRKRRDIEQNEMRAALIPWLASRDDLPVWLLRKTLRFRHNDPTLRPDPTPPQALAIISQWRSPAKFAKLARSWAKQRWPGDDIGYELLEKWRYHDHHLWEWESSQRRKAQNRRKDLYRCTVSELVNRYNVFVIENFRISNVATLAKPEEAVKHNNNPERHATAVSEFVLALQSTASFRGASVVKVDCAYSTQECPECGQVNAWDAARSITRRPPCPACGSEHDQDYGAAQVLLKRYSTKGSGGTGGNPKKKKGRDPELTKWQRVAKARAEKVARRKEREGAQNQDVEMEVEVRRKHS